MSNLTIANSFSPNTTALSALVNQNFQQIVTWSTAIDNTNIGPAGIFASQIVPLTAGEATFGGVTAGVGYKFLAASIGAVPLTLSGVSGQTADLFDITLTSGGTKALLMNAAGALSVGGSAFGSFGDVNASRNATQGLYSFGSTAGTSGSVNFNITNPTAHTFLNAGGAGFSPIFAGAYTNSACDVNLKEDYALLDNPLATLMKLEAREYTYKPTGSRVVGLTAQQVAKVFPSAAKVVNDKGRMGVTYDNVTALFIAAFQQYVIEHP